MRRRRSPARSPTSSTGPTSSSDFRRPASSSPSSCSAMSARSAHHGARQSDAQRSCPSSRSRRASRRDDLHRPLRLSQSGQQRPLLPLYFPRRARRRGVDHQRGHEESGECAPSPRSFEKAPSEVVARAYGGEGLAVRPYFAPIPSPFESAADAAHRAGGGARCDGGARVARRPIADFDAYADRLRPLDVFRSGFMMKPIFAASAPRAKARHLFRGRGRAGVAREHRSFSEERLAVPVLIRPPPR